MWSPTRPITDAVTLFSIHIDPPLRSPWTSTKPGFWQGGTHVLELKCLVWGGILNKARSCLFVCLSVCLFVCLSVCLFVCLFVCWEFYCQSLLLTHNNRCWGSPTLYIMFRPSSLTSRVQGAEHWIIFANFSPWKLATAVSVRQRFEFSRWNFI